MLLLLTAPIIYPVSWMTDWHIFLTLQLIVLSFWVVVLYISFIFIFWWSHLPFSGVNPMQFLYIFLNFQNYFFKKIHFRHTKKWRNTISSIVVMSVCSCLPPPLPAWWMEAATTQHCFLETNSLVLKYFYYAKHTK